MLKGLSGKTRIFMIIGNPIGQVKSAADITESFRRRGKDAVNVPIEINPERISDFFTTITNCTNVDGMTITIPFKFKAAKACATLTPRASFLGAANVLRRNKDGTWHGDMTDGIGFCNAIEQEGSTIMNRKALLIGAGGAGSAIGLGLLERGVSSLSIFDIDQTRSLKLVDRLNKKYSKIGNVVTKPELKGFDIVAHASPTGMKKTDALPLDPSELVDSMHIGDVVTEPSITPLIRIAKGIGCNAHTGIQMWKGHQEILVDFLLHEENKNNL